MQILKERQVWIITFLVCLAFVVVYNIFNKEEDGDGLMNWNSIDLINILSNQRDYPNGIGDGGNSAHAKEVSGKNNLNGSINSLSNRDKMSNHYCSIKSCGERPSRGPHATPLRSELVELAIGIENMELGAGYSKLKDMTVWDLVDANYWRKKKLTMFEISYRELQARLATAEVELEKIKKEKVCDKRIENDGKISNDWPLYYGDCETKWERIVPSHDADYERDFGVIPPTRTQRIDGLKQPDKIEDKYEIMICRNNKLEGTIRIRKYAQYCNDQGVKFTDNPDTERLIRNFIGEDEFRFQLAGPEVIALEFKPIGWCRYISQYKLRIPGVYHLHLIWTHENWAAVNEMLPKHYPSHLDYPLGFEDQYLPFGLDASIINDTFNIMQQTKKDYVAYLEKYKTMPDCKREDARSSLKGSWILKLEVIFNFHKPLEMFLEMGKGKVVRKKPHTRAMVDYNNYMYIPFGCKLQPKQDDLLKQKIEGKNVTFVGDSQTRGLLAAVLERDCEEYVLQSAKLRQLNFSTRCIDNKLLKKCKTFQYVNKLCIIGQNLGDVTTGVEADIVISNFGQHPASNYHWKYHQYAQKITSNIEIIKEFNGKYIWLETFPMPYSKEAWTELYQDWRTESRLTTFNYIANSNFQYLKNVYMVLPSHHQIYSFFIESSDDAHYPYPILSGIVDILYHYLQLD